MATPTEMTDYEKIRQPWILLQSKEAIEEQISKHKDKVVVLLFNLSEAHRNSVEHILKQNRHQYEKTAVFFKCPVIQNTDALPVAFNVKQVPTILFFHNGETTPYKTLVKPTNEQLLAELKTFEEKKT